MSEKCEKQNWRVLSNQSHLSVRDELWGGDCCLICALVIVMVSLAIIPSRLLTFSLICWFYCRSQRKPLRLVLQKWQVHLTILWLAVMWVGFLKTGSGGHTLCSYQINMSRTYLGSDTCFLFAQCKHGQKWCFQKPYATNRALQPKETFAAHNLTSEKQRAISRWCFWSVSVSRDTSNRCFLQKQELVFPRREIIASDCDFTHVL